MKKIKYIIVNIALITYGFTATPYFLCEGNFMSDNASLWFLDHQGEVNQQTEHPVGDTAQSLLVHDNRLYVVVNGSSAILVYDILSDGSLDYLTSISTNFSGPREMVILGDYAYITEWYSAAIAVMDINLLEIVGSIPAEGLAEGIVTDGSFLYVSITMDSDWMPSDQVIVIDPLSSAIVNTYTVGQGPGQLLLVDNYLYVSGIYYDLFWNTFAVTSRINLDTDDVIINDYGVTFSFGGDITYFNGNVYRTYNGGIAALDDDLNIQPDTQIGNYAGVYSMATNEGLIYLGLSDYLAPDQVVVLDSAGTELANYEVGAIPGDFAFYTTNTNCVTDGDVNGDGTLDILDVVQIVGYILGNNPFSDTQLCSADNDLSGDVDILDVVAWINELLNG